MYLTAPHLSSQERAPATESLAMSSYLLALEINILKYTTARWKGYLCEFETNSKNIEIGATPLMDQSLLKALLDSFPFTPEIPLHGSGERPPTKSSMLYNIQKIDMPRKVLHLWKGEPTFL